jgi:lipopolysaccharide/colanic/teichoic acid biosynthesis glycosyltransferase
MLRKIQRSIAMSKRVFDFAAAAAALVVLCPAWLAIAALIWREDGGSPLFVQDRIGFRKRPFPIYKFRTMRDGRITRIGRVLRTTGLDEIPQLINVLRGEMSLVGPRPLTPADVTRLGWDGHAHALRWSVGPGITGLAQLYAGRGARLSWFLDRRYVESRHPRLDAVIIGLTLVIAMIGKRRVRGWLRRYSVRATVSGGAAGDCARRIRNGTLLTTPLTSAAKR